MVKSESNIARLSPPMYRVGIDLVEITKVQKVFEKRRTLQETVFTPEEVRYSMRQRYPFVHLAVCFAVKEAFFKALGTGLSGEMDWRDVEVLKEKLGKSIVRVLGATALAARDMGVLGYRFSFAHAGEFVVAVAAVEMGEYRI